MSYVSCGCFREVFDAVWRNNATYRFYKTSMDCKLLSGFHSFLNGRHLRNLVNTHFSNKFQTNMGVPLGYILTPLIFPYLHNRLNRGKSLIGFNINSKIDPTETPRT